MQWEVLDTKVLVNYPWVRVRDDRVRFENGQTQDITVVENKVGVHVLPITDRREVILVDKVSYPAGLSSHLEIPGGVWRPGFELVDEAIRECAEETGFRPRWTKPMLTLHKGPFRLANESHVFLGMDLERLEHWETDLNELINGVAILPLSKAMEEIGQSIVDALTVAAIYHYYKNLV